MNRAIPHGSRESGSAVRVTEFGCGASISSGIVSRRVFARVFVTFVAPEFVPRFTRKRLQIHLNARAMTPTSAPDISSHQTRSNARAECNAAIAFSTFASSLATRSSTGVSISNFKAGIAMGKSPDRNTLFNCGI
jgi:hypothetical protein